MDMNNVIEAVLAAWQTIKSMLYTIVLAVLKPIVYLDVRYKYAVLALGLVLSIFIWLYYLGQRKNMDAVVYN